MSAHQSNWENIPAEMRAMRQWAVCGPEYDTAVPKRPYNPLTRRPASPTDSSTWVTFEEAVASGVTAIGFMLSEYDPLFVIDLDTYKSEAPENHRLILEAAGTYAERSQSGQGMHIIGRGIVGDGRNSRAHAIEIYDRDRFIIMTGNRVNDFAIANDQEIVDLIIQRLGGGSTDLPHQYETTISDEADADLVRRISSYENGAKFDALMNGNVLLDNGKDGDGALSPQQDALAYPSQSEADMALLSILCFHSTDDAQVARIFAVSALGQREKAQRKDYAARCIKRARLFGHRTELEDQAVAERIRSGLLGGHSSGNANSAIGLNSQNLLPSVILRCVSDVESKPISWLWLGRFALGRLGIIAGHPGLGKSQFTAMLAATVSTGGAWPNGEGNAPIGQVVMLSCEDDIADTIRPRLEAAGADLTKVHVLEAIVEKKGGRRVFSLKRDIEHMRQVLDQLETVFLVVIDPVTAYLDGSDSHNTADVRAALAPLQDLAMEGNFALVVVSHLNKSGGGGQAINAVTGSGAFVAASRASFLIASDPDDQDRRLFLSIKNNLAKPPGLAFHIQSRTVSNEIEAPLLVFEHGAVATTADEALTGEASNDTGARAIDDATSFLIRELRDGPQPQKELVEHAEVELISLKTLRNAKKKLGVVAEKAKGKNSGWLWRLPPAGLMSNMPQNAPS